VADDFGRLKPGTQLASAQAAVSGLFRNEMLHGAMPLFHGERDRGATRPRDGHGQVATNAHAAPEVGDCLVDGGMRRHLPRSLGRYQARRSGGCWAETARGSLLRPQLADVVMPAWNIGRHLRRAHLAVSVAPRSRRHGKAAIAPCSISFRKSPLPPLAPKQGCVPGFTPADNRQPPVTHVGMNGFARGPDFADTFCVGKAAAKHRNRCRVIPVNRCSATPMKS